MGETLLCPIIGRCRGAHTVTRRRKAMRCGWIEVDVFDVIVVGGGRKASLARPRQESRGRGDLARAGGTRVVTAVAAIVVRAQPMRVD